MSQFPVIYATDIGEYIRHQSCERRFKLDYNRQEEAKKLLFWGRLQNPLDLALQRAGSAREDEWETQLINAGAFRVVDNHLCVEADANKKKQLVHDWGCFVDQLRMIADERLCYGRQVKIVASIGAFDISGIIDFVLLKWDEGKPRLVIIECKSSRRDRTHHRIQVALYRMLVRRWIRDSPVIVNGAEISSENIDCVVARVDETTNRIQDILSLPPLEDLTQEEGDILRLLAPDGRLAEIIETGIDELPYELNEKCNSCKFNVCCLPVSAIKHNLQLLGIDAGTTHALHLEGISNIDQLANLDTRGEQASRIRANHRFISNLEILKIRASARAATLPGSRVSGKSYEVLFIPFDKNRSQLPDHEINGKRVMRVYLCVDYDYVENRIGALTAHVTASEGMILTPFKAREEGGLPIPKVAEVLPNLRQDNTAPTIPLSEHSRDIVRFQTDPWTGRYRMDSISERYLIEYFMNDLINAIADLSDSDEVPIHIYVWSRSEIAHLVEACSRAGSSVLSHLNQLLGCREGLEQLIYSCLQEEIHNRFAFGWTGRGLVVASVLRWPYGWRYHWTRRLLNKVIDLEHAFEQDLFDFKTTLAIENKTAKTGDNWGIQELQWAEPGDPNAQMHRFEIRARFFDSLPAPYWLAVWKTLTKPGEKTDGTQAFRIIDRYQRAALPNYLIAYLKERAHALRWIEERVQSKNPQIQKPSIRIADLKRFSLEVESIRDASLDFLRLDQHVNVTDWTARHLEPPLYRISSGRTIPVKNAFANKKTINATIDLENFDVTYDALKANCSIEEGSFVRLTPCLNDPHRGQTFAQLYRAGVTCVVSGIDWSDRHIVLDVIPNYQTDAYCLKSVLRSEPGLMFENATVDESPSDFVARRVDKTLEEDPDSAIYNWFDPIHPQIPAKDSLTKSKEDSYEELLRSFVLPSGHSLNDLQRRACVKGLSTRIQLLHGPPGTGKTDTTAVALLLRTLERSEGEIIVVTANTHTALNILLQRVEEMLLNFKQQVSDHKLSMPQTRLAKAVLSPSDPVPDGVEAIKSERPAPALKKILKSNLLIIGGTVAAILKMWKNRGKGFQGHVSTLIVDEASMMKFPDFLALATTVDPVGGDIMLAGDHLQLDPIVAHEWEKEDRPPIVLYHPFDSAYEAVRDLRNHADMRSTQIDLPKLQTTYRLQQDSLDLVTPIYKREGIDLERPSEEQRITPRVVSAEPWCCVWDPQADVYLVTHNEKRSWLNNEVEARIIEQILASGGPLPCGSVAIITPHCAQRSGLKERLAKYTGPTGPVFMIDTVEHLQGGQREVTIVSVCESDPSAIGKNAKFIFDTGRTNVSFTRAKKTTIVVCAESLLDYTPSELKDYYATSLFKSLRARCPFELERNPLDVNGVTYEVKIFSRKLSS
ncbi:MAG: AAA domain-containing protein [Halobacteriota archaeon]